MPPLAILFLAIMTQPLPTLAAGKVSFGLYLLHTLGSILALFKLGYGFFRLLAGLPGQLTSTIGLLREYFLRLQLKLPWVNWWIIRRQKREVSFYLALLLEAGLPTAQALPLAATAMHYPILQQRLHAATATLHKGIL
jgi:type II secretory pathway component PulF